MGLVAFFFISIILSGQAVKHPGSHETGYSFRPGDTASHSDFARQAADGELEDSDGDPRSATRAISQAGITLLSLSLSGTVSILKSQRPPVTVAGGSRPILYCRLTI